MEEEISITEEKEPVNKAVSGCKDFVAAYKENNTSRMLNVLQGIPGDYYIVNFNDMDKNNQLTFARLETGANIDGKEMQIFVTFLHQDIGGNPANGYETQIVAEYRSDKNAQLEEPIFLFNKVTDSPESGAAAYNEAIGLWSKIADKSHDQAKVPEKNNSLEEKEVYWEPTSMHMPRL